MEEIIYQILEQKIYIVQLFDWERYLNQYSDLTKSGIETQDASINHMIEHGRFNSRDLFDTEGKKYIHSFNKSDYVKLIDMQFETEIDAYLHWCNNRKDMKCYILEIFL